MDRLMQSLKDNGVEFRRGSAGGGNQLRQPYLQNFIKAEAWKAIPVYRTSSFLRHVYRQLSKLKYR